MNDDALPRLLYVEDQEDAAAITVEMLSSDYRVTHFSTGEAALRAVLREPFDLMVFDRRLPGMSGTELLAKVRRAGLATPVLLLTALGTIDDRVDGLDSGANDYLVKPFDFAELKARLRALHRGFRSQSSRRYIGQWTLLPQTSRIIGPYDQSVSLTEAETKMLDVLSSNPDHVFSRAELLRACFPTGESPGTIESYVHHLRRKTAPELIRTVRGRGYQIGQDA